MVSEDVNGDGVVDVKDLVYVAERYGQTGTTTADVNGDGIVNIDDLILVAAALDAAAAPSLYSNSLEQLSVSDVRLWLSEARGARLNRDPSVQRGILFLEQLLTMLVPKETALLANYPNPFNPGDVDTLSIVQVCGCSADYLRLKWASDSAIGIGTSTCGYL